MVIFCNAIKAHQVFSAEPCGLYLFNMDSEETQRDEFAAMETIAPARKRKLSIDRETLLKKQKSESVGSNVIAKQSDLSPTLSPVASTSLVETRIHKAYIPVIAMMEDSLNNLVSQDLDKVKTALYNYHKACLLKSIAKNSVDIKAEKAKLVENLKAIVYNM